MPEGRDERRIAAILAADVVGYSRLIEADEARTLAALRLLRADLVDPEIAEQRGRIVKLMGDGLIAEFGSVVDAVVCAVAIQKKLADRQTELLPERRIVFRIGVNLGDVVVDGEDLFGDGVNVAARLEQLCEPGGVLVSGTAFDQLQGKLDLPLDFIGEQQVKNVSRPVRAYSVRLDGKRRAPPLVGAKLRRWLPLAAAVVLVAAAVVGGGIRWFKPLTPADAKPSMVVLPFDNLSDDKEQGYLADGISEDLTTELARVPGLMVISRTAAFTYKGKEVLPDQISREMGVRYILEGSIRRAGDEMRINAQLIDGSTGAHLWAERFDGPWSDVFLLQDKVVKAVATALELRLIGGGTDTTAGGTANVEAYKAFLQGLELEIRGSPQDFAEAVPHFKKAIALDPNYGRAYAELAWVYQQSAGDEQSEKALGIGFMESLKLVTANLDEAMKHPSASAYQLSGERHMNRWKVAEAISDLDHAIALDPSDVWGYRQMARAQVLAGNPNEGLTYVDASLRVDPREDAFALGVKGLAEFSLERYADAAASLERSVKLGNLGYRNLLPLTAAYGQLGSAEKAAAAKTDLEAVAARVGDINMTALLAAQYVTFDKLPDVLRFQEGLIKAGVPELPFGFDPKSKDRLTGDEMHKLLFGHKIAGHVLDNAVNAGTKQAADFKSGVPFSLSIAADGTDVDYTWGDASDSGGGIHFEGNRDCMYHKETAACAAIFRNPSGTREEQNEYYWLAHWNLIAFSVVE